MPYVHPSGMVKFFRVKEKARGLARQQKFDQARAEYRAAIAQAEADGDMAALRNLYNAAGDASLQLSDAAAAVEYFEKAADLYLDEGLYDNAIALCHKILRHVPTKAEAYARLGRIYAEKGLRSESIQNWLEFTDRRQKANDLSGMTTALREVVALASDLDGVRLRLAEVLLARGEVREALTELEELRRRSAASGDAARAAELEARTAALRREHGIPEEPETPGAAAEHAPAEAAEAERPPAEPPPLGLETLPGMEERAGAAAGGTLPGLDSGFGFSSAAPGIAPPAAAGAEGAGREGSGAGAVGPRPSLEPPPESPSRPGVAPAEQPLPPVGTLPGFTPPETEAPPLAGPGERADVVTGIPPIAVVPVDERIARAEARLAESPHDAEERIYLAELYQEAGTIDLARSAMGQGASELMRIGEAEKAWRAYRRLVALAPEEIEVVQKLVDVAQAAGNREMLLQSYELLGDRLMEAGRYGPAADIHRRILEIDPAHRHSQDQLLLLEGLEPPRPAVAGGGGDGGGLEVEYVDLARLIGESEPARRADPRMTVRAQPTGDDEADLQAIIEAFRQGVELNIDEGDYESHYDLGVAFRQMGLLDEAIREFQLAARGGEHRERAFELMGLCFMEKGMATVAVNCFRRGIESERDPHTGLGLHYHLARSLEELGQTDAARDEYARVVALDVRFLDAAERLKRLS